MELKKLIKQYSKCQSYKTVEVMKYKQQLVVYHIMFNRRPNKKIKSYPYDVWKRNITVLEAALKLHKTNIRNCDRRITSIINEIILLTK